MKIIKQKIITVHISSIHMQNSLLCKLPKMMPQKVCEVILREGSVSIKLSKAHFTVCRQEA
jgi:hypothetical protein